MGVVTTSKKNSLSELLNPLRHTDHKVTGLSYIIAFAITVYYILTDISFYESNLWIHMSTAVIGIIVNLSALRNFRFLAKSAENPGMFAQNRTFSYAFLQENLWFQFLLGLSFVSAHPLTIQYFPPDLQIATIVFIFIVREFVPKTSYVSWEQGNKKVNSRLNGRVDFINLQVKIVRWNYVLKKTLLFYLFVAVQAEFYYGVPQGSFVDQLDRKCLYLLSLDAMHNVTTAFFLQTLKFKGFISAETFSFLFNVSPICGVFVTYQFLNHHHFLYPYLAAVLVELFVNITFVYPSKKLTNEWKNRCLVALKLGTITAASTYMALTPSSYANAVAA